MSPREEGRVCTCCGDKTAGSWDGCVASLENGDTPGLNTLALKACPQMTVCFGAIPKTRATERMDFRVATATATG